nr:VWA-like domain-containing protein [Lachnospiraceae bacterium]
QRERSELEKKDEVARRILEGAVHRITEKIPEFDYAFRTFTYHPVEMDIRISTDGRQLLYNPKSVVNEYREDGISQIQLELLHVLLHYLRGDILTYRQCAHKELMSAAIDREVTDALQVIGMTGEYDAAAVGGEGSPLYYKYKYENKNMQPFPSEENAVIHSDEHRLWLVPEKLDLEKMKQLIENVLGKEAAELFAKNPIQYAAGFSSNMKRHGYTLIVSTGNDAYGNCAGDGAAEHHAAASRADYREEIRRLLRGIEAERESTEVLDRAMYCYGLSMYGDRPLTEPGEDECEIQGLSLIAIAIDTSGSCSGEIADRFLGEVAQILRQSGEYFTDRTELLLFTCDAEIQSEETIRGADLRKMKLKDRVLNGWGGTSFVPVFHRIAELGKKKSRRVDGLIYLTDGYGAYPTEKPDYPVIFVLPGSERESRRELPAYINTAYFD